MTYHSLLAAGLIAVAIPTALFAQERDCPMTYDVYEVGVPHTDLETCPASIDIEEAYCQVSVVAEIATVFVFSEADDCLVASRNYFEDEFTLDIE